MSDNYELPGTAEDLAEEPEAEEVTVITCSGGAVLPPLGGGN